MSGKVKSFPFAGMFAYTMPVQGSTAVQTGICRCVASDNYFKRGNGERSGLRYEFGDWREDVIGS